MKLRQKTWLFKKKTQQFMISNELKSNGRMIKGSLLAIIVGFIVAGIVIAAQNVNAFEYYGNLLKIAFSGLYVDQTLQWFSVYIIAGLAVAVGFKTGVFNIGVAGQMLAGASLATVMFNLAYPKATTMNGGMIFAIFLVCVLSGALLAGLAGWLKAMFNIHEVVSTIMLNWVVWYLFKFIFVKWSNDFTPGEGVSTNPFPTGLLDWGGSEIAVPIIVALVAVFVIWIIFSKTVFGFRLKAVGSSTTVSKYAGISVKNKIIAAMTISGALAGLASFLNIFTVSPNLTFGVDNLPTVGYDAIAVSLVAFNNPFGVVGVSILWGVVQSAGGSAAALFNMPSQLSLLIFGIVVYFAAIAIVFIKWTPSYKIKLRYYIWNSKLYSTKTQALNKQVLKYRWWIHEPNRNSDYKKQMTTFKKEMSEAQSPEKVEQIKVQIKEYKFDFKENCRLNISKYETLLKNYKTQLYLEKINHGLQGIKRRARQRVNEVNEHGVHEINLSTLELVKTRDFYENSMIAIREAKTVQIAALKIQLRKDKHALRVWKENQLGELQLDFALSSGKIAAKGEFSKQKSILEEDIKNAHSDQRLKFHLIRFDSKLTAEQKKIERHKVQIETQKRILRLKKQIQDLKVKMNQEIAALNFQHQLKALDLKADNTLILKIKTEYQARLTKLMETYEQDLQIIENEEKVRISKFDQNKSTVDVQKGQTILQKCQTKLHDEKFAQPTDLKKEIKNLHQQLEIINDSVAELYLVFTRNNYQEYDNNQALKQKMKIFLRLAEWEHLCQVQLTITQTNLALNKVKKKNEQIETKFKTELKIIKKDYQSNKEIIKKDKNKQGSNYQQSLINNEQVYVDKINASVDQLETQYLVQGVN